MDLHEIIAETQAKVQAIISKPRLTDKLLSKPPFRFLHDIVTAITAATGFAQGLYSGDELDSTAITDKNAKIAYLEKLITCVGHSHGRPVDVRPAKIVAGLEPEATNGLLQMLAEAATDLLASSVRAVQSTLAGEPVGAAPAAERNESKSRPAVPEDPVLTPAAIASAKQERPTRESYGDIKQMKGEGKKGEGPQLAKDAEESLKYSDRPHSTVSAKIVPPTSGLGEEQGLNADLSAEIQGCDGSVEKTQATLGRLIQKPKLAEKLLSKPPFRFLHDIVMEVMRVTGFGEGLYDESLIDSNAVKDKESKMLFLERIISLVGTQLNTFVEAKPAKIVAGLEPNETNRMLQLLALAARCVPHTEVAVRIILGDLGGQPSAELQRVQVEPESSVRAPPQQPQMQANLGSEDKEKARKSPESVQEHTIEGAKGTTGAANQDKLQQPSDELIAPAPDGKDDTLTAGEDETTLESKRSIRPTTARRRPPKVREHTHEVKKQEKLDAPVGILLEGSNVEDEDDDKPSLGLDEKRLAEDVELKTVVGGSERHGKLVQDIMKKQSEEDQGASTKNEDTQQARAAEADTGIKLGRLKRTGDTKSATVATFDEADIKKIQMSVQTLVQAASPIGKCMDYVQEDLQMMNNELQKWQEMCKLYEREYTHNQQKTEEVLQPLRLELLELEDQVRAHQQRVGSGKSTIAGNENRIEQLLRMIVHP